MTDLVNRSLGARAARFVVYVGFPLAVALSAILGDARIALASGTAFLVGQLLDISIFDQLRRSTWWRAPLISSTLRLGLGHDSLLQPGFLRHRRALGEVGDRRLQREDLDGAIDASSLPSAAVGDAA